MKLKGVYSPATSYNVGDVVVCDGLVYHLQKAAPSGTYPTDTRYWGKTNQNTAEQILLLVDTINTTAGEIEAKIPDNISEDGIILNGTAEGSTDQYLVTVDDTDPDAPGIDVTKVED